MKPSTPRLAAAGAAIAAALALGAMAGPAAAQLGNPGFWEPATMADPPGKPAPTRTNVVDQLFVQLISAGDRTEVQAAELAAKRGGNAAVKEFAQQMKTAHSDSASQLAAIVDKLELPVAKELPPDQQATLTRLESLEGAAFDAAYLQTQLVEHHKAAQLLVWEIGQGQNGDLQRHAAATLVGVMAHMESIQRLLAEHTTVGLQGLAGR